MFSLLEPLSLVVYAGWRRFIGGKCLQAGAQKRRKGTKR
ncbi:hypothetical protein B4113_4135 [Geobacillus sp. B4113_201601]|nr:hypothetical protein B4113_4135 [Geobacillus sp. B4113_201601]